MGRVGNRYVWQGGQTENQGGQTKKIFSALRAEFCPPWPETLPAPLKLGLLLDCSDYRYPSTSKERRIIPPASVLLIRCLSRAVILQKTKASETRGHSISGCIWRAAGSYSRFSSGEGKDAALSSSSSRPLSYRFSSIFHLSYPPRIHHFTVFQVIISDSS